MSSAGFAEEDFGVWKITTAVVSLPAKIVGKDKATVDSSAVVLTSEALISVVYILPRRLHTKR